MAPKFLGCNRGTNISNKRIIWDWTWQMSTLGSNLQARSSGTSNLSNTALAQTHRSSSMASSWLIFWTKNSSKNWDSYVTVSWQTNRRAKNEYITCSGRDDDGTPSWLKGMWLAQFFRIFFNNLFFVFWVTRRWARNEALSQLRGTEPATREWWICTVRDRWVFRCSLCSSNKSNYWLILAPNEIK